VTGLRYGITLLGVGESKRELLELRQQVAALDGDLLSLLDKRAKAARRVGELRKDQPATLPLTDQAAIGELVSGSSGDMPSQPLREIFGAIFAACLALELPVKVTFVGLEGGPGHEAARGRFGQTASLKAIETTAAALEDVARKAAEFAVVPFETSTESPVQPTIAALIASELRIVEVQDAPFDLHLLNRSGDVPDIAKVFATAADYALCEKFLNGLSPAPAVVHVRTPLTAYHMALEDSAAAAVGSESFAALLGLHVARRSVLDAGRSRVRYAIIGTRPSGRTGNEVTSFVFSVDEAPGALLEVLKVFAERGINLKKMQSHPVQGETWRYLFCAETAGHFTDRPLVMAFEEIKRVTRFFKLLGSYPAP
jgi:chorismate mutase / prephenate dehydratase